MNINIYTYVLTNICQFASILSFNCSMDRSDFEFMRNIKFFSNFEINKFEYPDLKVARLITSNSLSSIYWKHIQGELDQGVYY